MDALERYLLDCENKRRRSRDRPSNEVLSDLRRLLMQVEDAVGRSPSVDTGSTDVDGAGLRPPPQL